MVPLYEVAAQQNHVTPECPINEAGHDAKKAVPSSTGPNVC